MYGANSILCLHKDSAQVSQFPSKLDLRVVQRETSDPGDQPRFEMRCNCAFHCMKSNNSGRYSINSAYSNKRKAEVTIVKHSFVDTLWEVK